MAEPTRSERIRQWQQQAADAARVRTAARLAAWKPGTCVMCAGPFPHPAPGIPSDSTCSLCGAPVVTGSGGGSHHADSRDGAHCLTVYPRERTPEPAPREQPAYAQESLFEVVASG